MSLILNIDTASETAIITIAKDGLILQEEKNTNPKEHAAFLQPAIQSLIKKAGISLPDIAAIAVNYGPGSYTGLRVGMASAKGLCYSLNKPLIVLNALEILTTGVIDEYSKTANAAPIQYCPMIDARRMEVFTAVYDKDLNTILEPCSLILDSGDSIKLLLNKKTLFFGSGAAKWKAICIDKNAHFTNPPNNGLAMSNLSFKNFTEKKFTSTAYSEPLYLKGFYSSHNGS